MMLKTTALALTSVSLLALAAGAPASAQSAPDSKSDKSQAAVNELIVTAQKREERVQDVPLSINVINQSQLERQQVNSVFDLSRIAPSLELTNAAGQAVGGGGQVRGIGTQSFGTGAVGSVGIVVDGVSQGNVNVSDLFDIERVEVLKGPQGTLFGLTTSAGVINITTQAQSFSGFSARARTELSGEGTAGSTGYGQQIYQAVVNIPLASNVAMRLSSDVSRRQGPGRNALDGSLDNHRSESYRARLLAKPTDRLDINLNADYSRQKGDGPDFFTVYKADPTLTAQLANCKATPTSTATPVVPSESNRDYCTTNTVVDGSLNYGGSVTAAYDFDQFTITSISAARRSRSVPYAGLDIFRLRNAFFAPPVPSPANIKPTDIAGVGSPNPGPTKLVNEELRAASKTGAKLEYTVGLFYSDLTNHNNGGNTNTVADYFALGAPPILLGAPTLGTPSSSQDFSTAVFGQATYHLTDQFGIIAGGRYTKEILKQHTNTTAGVAAYTRADISNTSWRFGLQYKVDPTLQTYATIAKGYKGPQLAAPATGSPAGTASRVVNPEIPTDYEVGAKKTLFGGRVIADASAFYIKVNGYQGQVCITDPVTQLLGCTVTNFDGVVSKGVELNLFGRVSDHLTLNTGLIWNKATYPKTSVSATGVVGPYRGPDGSDLSGAQLINAPVWKFTFSGEYSQDVFTGIEGFVGADAVYKSTIRYAPSQDPLLSYPSNWVIGGHIGVRAPNGKWSASAFVRNLTDEHTPVLRQTGFPYGANYGQFLSTGSFRVVGVMGDVRF